MKPRLHPGSTFIHSGNNNINSQLKTNQTLTATCCWLRHQGWKPGRDGRAGQKGWPGQDMDKQHTCRPHNRASHYVREILAIIIV